MPKGRLTYHEGDCFAVPLETGGYGMGVVARMNGRGILLAYFFGPRRSSPPSRWRRPNPSDALLVELTGDLELLSGRWAVIPADDPWNRTRWPIPIFANVEPGTDRAWRVEVPDDLEFAGRRDTPIGVREALQMRRYGVTGGAGAAVLLDRLLPLETVSETRDRDRADATDGAGRLDIGDSEASVSDGRVDVGHMGFEQAVIVHLYGDRIPGDSWEEIERLEERLSNTLAKLHLGQYDGNELTEGEAVLFMYGTDAGSMYEAIKPILSQSTFYDSGRVLVRDGGPGAWQREHML